MQTTNEIVRGIKGVIASLGRRERFIHFFICLLGILIINVPQLELTFGVFHGDDYSLILPSLFGTLINGLIFYGNIFLVQNRPDGQFKEVLKMAVLWFCFLCVIEILLDSFYFYAFYDHFTTLIFWDISLGTFLLNGIFFFIPGIVYGIFKEKMIQKTSSKFLIKDGAKQIYIALEDLMFVESDSNYSVFHSRTGKYLERKSLSKLENELPSQFVRCHKSFIVNSNLIDKKTYNEIEIAGNKIPIGRKYGKDIALTFLTLLQFV